MHQDDIIKRVSAERPEAAIDIAGADCNFGVRIVVEDFAGQALLQRQERILGLFQEELRSGALLTHSGAFVFRCRSLMGKRVADGGGLQFLTDRLVQRRNGLDAVIEIVDG
ncbi:MAG: hypothetical protein WBG92_03260 [Thiohalocapsa sp.]